ncbi:MAG TPA: inositol monophosphatase family protein [Nitrososphaeraceae archaeon]|jgi:myo-inositol-1(or 4)-monophosphatase|nr:inositol monophosphatase family protein [Nitrososphaeraceae archaeon]
MLQILKDACRIAYAETEKLIGTPQAGTKFNQGAGGDISRRIDLVAENAVLQTVRESSKNPTIIGEECGVIEGNEGFLIMDAVDGTTNALRGVPFCCCSLAYATDPKLSSVTDAAVMDLANGDLFYASKNHGAYLNERRIHVTQLDNLDFNDLIAGVNISGISEETIVSLTPLIIRLKHVRHFGANALELCYLARGFLDLCIDLRMKIRPTDLAASYLIVHESGGRMFDPVGKPFDSTVYLGSALSYIAVPHITVFDYFEDNIKYFLKETGARAGI